VAAVATACVLLAMVVWQVPPSSAPETLVSIPEARPASAEAVLRYATWHRDGGEKKCVGSSMHVHIHTYIHTQMHVFIYMLAHTLTYTNTFTHTGMSKSIHIIGTNIYGIERKSFLTRSNALPRLLHTQTHAHIHAAAKASTYWI